MEPALLKRYAQIFEEEPPKHSLGKVCRVDETTQLQLLKYGYILIDKNGELFAKEILANDPTERYIRELLFNYYLYNNELERAKQLLTEDLRLNSLKQETTRRLWDSWQNAMFIEERYEEVFDMIKQAEYITYVQGVFPLLNSINVTKETSPNDKLPSSLLVSVISNGFDRLESSPAQEENAYFAELETQIRVIWNAGLTLTSHNLLVQEDIERYAARLTTILENGLTKFYPNKRNRKYSSTKEVYQGNIDALKIQLQNKTHEPSL